MRIESLNVARYVLFITDKDFSHVAINSKKVRNLASSVVYRGSAVVKDIGVISWEILST